MTHIKLIKSGGFIGLIQSAETDTSVDKQELIQAFTKAAAKKNMQARDAENYVVYVDEAHYSIDAEALTGAAKKLIDSLVDHLKPVKL